MPQIFITIVRFVLPSDDKYVQKLLLLYMEIIEKTDSSGKILPEMILICQNLRNNLQHPNEFLRGATLRFLCRITEAEILEPLIPSIVACLEHRHSFVRRNAVLCMDRIYQMPGGDMLLQDAPETIERFLSGGESDLSTRRNAFLMLYNNDQDRAVSFLLQNVEQVANWGDILQNVVLDLIGCASTNPDARDPTHRPLSLLAPCSIPKSRGACRARNAPGEARAALACSPRLARFVRDAPPARDALRRSELALRAHPQRPDLPPPSCPCLGGPRKANSGRPMLDFPTADARRPSPRTRRCAAGPHAEGQVHQDVSCPSAQTTRPSFTSAPTRWWRSSPPPRSEARQTTAASSSSLSGPSELVSSSPQLSSQQNHCP